MKTLKELLGSRIKEIRKLKRLSQEQLSERVGIDPKHLSRIEVGRGFLVFQGLHHARFVGWATPTIFILLSFSGGHSPPYLLENFVDSIH